MAIGARYFAHNVTCYRGYGWTTPPVAYKHRAPLWEKRALESNQKLHQKKQPAVVKGFWNIVAI